jgi:hypothetical protein
MNQDLPNPITPAEGLSFRSLPSVPPDPTPRPTCGLSCLSGLSPAQLERINTWLDDAVPYRKIVELCRTEFQLEIPHMTIARYNKRSAARTLVNDLTDSKEACIAISQISQYAATGDVTFSTATLELLEQQAFDLALAFNRDTDAGDLQTLNQLWALIHKAKNTAIRERHAKVQETKCDLRKKELEIKEKLATARLSSHPPGGTSSASSASPTSNQKSKIPLEPFPSDETLAAWGVKPEYLLPFGSDYRAYIPQLARNLNRSLEEFFTTLARNRASAAAQTNVANPDLPSNPSDSPGPTANHGAETPSLSPQRAEGKAEGCALVAEDQSAPNCSDPTTAAPPFKIRKSGTDLASAPSTSDFEVRTSDLSGAVDAYTVERAKEYWAYRRKYSDPPLPRKSHPEYITQYKHCPCGSVCPCPSHEAGEFRPFPKSFWSLSPHSTQYASHLIDRGLPYRNPTEFV